MDLFSSWGRLVRELKRRHVFRVAGVYATVAFVVVQVAALVFPALEIPDWAYSLVVVLALLGFPVALVLAWALEVTPEGVRRAGPMERRRDGARHRTPALAAGAVALVLAATVALVLLPSDDGPILAGANTMAVVPLTPAVPDTSLARIGREMAVTLSANLEGAGGIRTASALSVLAQVEPDRPVDRAAAAGLARKLGAASVVHGTVLRDGPRTRVDLELLATASGETLARVAASAPADDLAALTDSATLALLRRIWVRGDAPVPSVGALTTRSVPALKAYVEGEDALARAEFGDAVRAFERAFAADSTFWFAYWRSLYPRVYEGSRPDTALLAAVYAHREELPAPDRALLESDLEEGMGARLAAKRALTRRFPTYWPGWYAYSNLLVHGAPFLGSKLEEARSALEETVALAPEFAPAWEHLFWTAVMQRDAERADAAFRRMESYGSDRHFKYHPDVLQYYRAIRDLTLSGGRATPEMLERNAEYLLGYTGSLPRTAFGVGLMDFGFGKAQVRLGDAVLARDPSPRLAAAMWLGKALGWTRAGAWDSALVAADRWVRLSPTGELDEAPDAPLVAYGLAVAGAHLGQVSADDAAARRPASLPAAVDGAEGRAELAWLDGLLAGVREDTAGLARARLAVRASGSRFADHLDASLAAFARALRGDSLAAGREIARLELEGADRYLPHAYGRSHPFVGALNRLPASRWLLAAGDTGTAARLLTWHEAELWDAHGHMDAIHQALAPLAFLQSARIAEARGLAERARGLRARFLEARGAPEDGDPPDREARAGGER